MGKEAYEVNLEEAMRLLDDKNTELVWMGKEPIDYIARLLDIKEDKFMQIRSDQLMHAKGDELKMMEGKIFVCYHGISSAHAVRFLERNKVHAYSLEGGITGVVGEIF